MNRRTSWEGSLRRRIKGRAKGAKTWQIQPYTWFLIGSLVLNHWMTLSALEHFGPAGESFGLAIAGSIAGIFLAENFQRVCCGNPMLWRFLPAPAATIRKMQLRNAVPHSLGLASLSMVAAVIGSLPLVSTIRSTAICSSAIALGFILGGGKNSRRVLTVAAVWVAGGTLWSGVVGTNPPALGERIISFAHQVWLPAVPWSADTQWLLPKLLLFFALLVTSVSGWIASWRLWVKWSVHVSRPHAPPEPPNQEEETEPAVGKSPPASDPPLQEELRSSLRQSVAHGWFGMAGYLPLQPMSRIDQWLWRIMTPRERMLSCLGCLDGLRWVGQFKIVAGCLVVPVIISLIARVRMDSGHVHSRVDEYSYHLFIAGIAATVVALICSWPARHSRFAAWTGHIVTEGFGPLPGFTIVPIRVSEWIRMRGKEWFLRGVLIASLWSLATLGSLELLGEPDLSFRRLLAVALAPWLILAALFPLSVTLSLFRSISGSHLNHGASRELPALAMAFICAGAIPALFAGLWNLDASLSLISLAIAGSAAWSSLRFTVARFRASRLDIRPRVTS